MHMFSFGIRGKPSFFLTLPDVVSPAHLPCFSLQHSGSDPSFSLRTLTAGNGLSQYLSDRCFAHEVQNHLLAAHIGVRAKPQRIQRA